MKVTILKKVSPFLFFLLMIALSVPGTAQQKVKNDHRQSVKTVGKKASTNRFEAVVTRKHSNLNYQKGATVSFDLRNTAWRQSRNANTNSPKGIRLDPYGHRIQFLPGHALTFRGRNQNYFFARGRFYAPTQFGYRVVRAPIGARINHLPHRARRVFYNRNVYYQVGNVMLASVVNRRGRVVYELVGFA